LAGGQLFEGDPRYVLKGNKKAAEMVAYGTAVEVV